MTYTFNTTNFFFTYSKNHVDPHVLTENHCHALYEIIAVLEGDINVTIEGQHYRLQESQAMIIPPLCYHAVTVNKTGDYTRVTSLFDKTAIPTVLQEEFVGRDVHPVTCRIPWHKDFYTVWENHPTPYHEPLIESMMVQLFYKRVHTLDAENTDTEADRFLPQIIAYIDDHLLDRIVLNDLARHTARSKSFVCHLFQKKMGIPPRQYILQKRMAYAQMKIREGHPATAVAEELGYKSYATFWRIYQKHHGVNPLKSKPKKNEGISNS